MKHRRRGLLAVGTVLALTGIAMALGPPPSSQAATGQKWLVGVPYAGYLTTNTGRCSVTVVSEWLAITAKHCGTVNPTLKLDVAATSSPGVVPVKRIEVNRDLDVEALILQNRTGLTVTPLRASVTQDRLSLWGYGLDRSNNQTNWLTRAEFDRPGACLHDVTPDRGNLCWDTTATNNMCNGDSGAPILQNGAIVGIFINHRATRRLPNGSNDCGTVFFGQGISVQQMLPWLGQMIKDADPFDN